MNCCPVPVDRPEASSSSLTVEGEPFLPGLLGQTGESRIDLGFLGFPRLFQGDTLLHHLLGLSAPLDPEMRTFF